MRLAVQILPTKSCGSKTVGSVTVTVFGTVIEAWIAPRIHLQKDTPGVIFIRNLS